MKLVKPVKFAPQQLSDSDYDLADAEIEKHGRVFEIAKANRRLYAMLLKSVGIPPSEVILTIGDHSAMMYKFLVNNCQHFVSLELAAAAMNDELILVYITEIRMYGVFTVDNYYDFVQDLSELECTQKLSSYTPKQVTLSGFPQRVVFMCNGDQAITDRIVEYCGLYFKSEVNVSKTGDSTDIIMQSPVAANLEQAKVLYKNFVEYVDRRVGSNSEKFGLRQNIVTKNGMEFVENNMGYHLGTVINNPIDLIKFFNGHPGSVTINFTNNGGNMFVGDNNVIKYAKEKKNTEAERWILSHPPNDRELKTAYYARYSKMNTELVSETQFAKIVAAVTKFTTLKSHGHNYWSLK